MEKIFDRIISWIDKLPVQMQILSLIVVTIFIIIYKIFSSDKMQRILILKMQSKLGKLTEKDLKAHNLFNRKEVYQNVIKNIKFESKNKTDIFKIILNLKL